MPKKDFWDNLGEGFLIGIDLADRRKARKIQERQIKLQEENAQQRKEEFTKDYTLHQRQVEVQEDYAQQRREEQAFKNYQFLYGVWEKAKDDKTRKTIGNKALDSLAKENLLSKEDEVILKSMLGAREYNEFYKELGKINDSKDPKTYSTDQYFGTLMYKQDQGEQLTDDQKRRLEAWENWRFGGGSNASKLSESEKTRQAISIWAPQIESGKITMEDVPAEWRPTLVEYGNVMYSIMSDPTVNGGGKFTWKELVDRVDDIYNADQKQDYPEDRKYSSWTDAYNDYVSRISSATGGEPSGMVPNAAGQPRLTYDAQNLIKTPTANMDSGQKAKTYFDMKRRGKTDTMAQPPQQTGALTPKSLEQQPLQNNPMSGMATQDNSVIDEIATAIKQAKQKNPQAQYDLKKIAQDYGVDERTLQQKVGM